MCACHTLNSTKLKISLQIRSIYREDSLQRYSSNHTLFTPLLEGLCVHQWWGKRESEKNPAVGHDLAVGPFPPILCPVSSLGTHALGVAFKLPGPGFEPWLAR